MAPGIGIFRGQAIRDVSRVTTGNHAQCYKIFPAMALDNYRGAGVPSCRFYKVRGLAS